MHNLSKAFNKRISETLNNEVYMHRNASVSIKAEMSSRDPTAQRQREKDERKQRIEGGSADMKQFL